MKNANFIAIDFETATTKRAACQIGIVVVKEGNIVEKISKFIQPPNNKYSDRCIKVHGITPDMTVDSPTFDIVWNDIKEYFEGNFIVAHNASFDLDVLYRALDDYHIPHPIFMGVACTYQLSGMSLGDACDTYSIPLCTHHDGICDAEACALLFLKYLKGEFYKSLERSINKEEEFNTLNNTEIEDYHIKHNVFDLLKHEHFLEECSINDPLKIFSDDMLSRLCPSPEFINKRFIITGGTTFDRNRAYLIIEKMGGKKSSSINKSLNYAILGKEPGPKKMEQIEILKNEGYNINVLSDSEFVELVKSSIKSYNNE